MSSLLHEIEEELRQEQFLNIWRKYGAYIIAAILTIILAIGGTTAWRAWQDQQAVQGTNQLLTALQDVQKAQDPAQAAQILEDYAKEAPAGLDTLAQFYQAGELLRAHKTDDAVRVYNAIANGHTKKDLRDLATILAAWHQIDRDAPELRASLIQQLQPLTSEDNPWHFSAQEMAAYLQLKQGQKDEAFKVLHALSQNPQTPDGIRQRAQSLMTVYGAAHE